MYIVIKKKPEALTVKSRWICFKSYGVLCAVLCLTEFICLQQTSSDDPAVTGWLENQLLDKFKISGEKVHTMWLSEVHWPYIHIAL